MICIITGKPFGGEAGLLGGEASPLPPPVDRTLLTVNIQLAIFSYWTVTPYLSADLSISISHCSPRSSCVYSNEESLHRINQLMVSTVTLANL